MPLDYPCFFRRQKNLIEKQGIILVCQENFISLRQTIKADIAICVNRINDSLMVVVKKHLRMSELKTIRT